MEKDEYYENECMTGTIKMKLKAPKQLKNFCLKISMKKFENFVLYNEDGT